MKPRVGGIDEGFGIYGGCMGLHGYRIIPRAYCYQILVPLKPMAVLEP